MAEQITFRGCLIRHFDFRRKEKVCFVRIHLTADYSTPVREKMDWSEMPVSITSAKLSGELNGTHFVLTPANKEMRQHELQLDINSADGFEFISSQPKEEGGSRNTKLNFIVHTSKLGAETQVAGYMRAMADSEGALKISYTKQEAMDLQASKDDGPSTGSEEAPPISAAPSEDDEPTDEPDEDDTLCVSCENAIPAFNGVHENGVRCKQANAAPLASVIQMGGRKKKDRKPRDPEAERKAQAEAGSHMTVISETLGAPIVEDFLN